MKVSAKHYTHESAKVLEGSYHEPSQPKPDETMYKLKWVLFLLVSLFLMYEAMTPTRKCPYKVKAQ